VTAKRSWLRLEIGVVIGLVLLVVAGLVAPRLWRDYQEARRTVRVTISADGTVFCGGRKVASDARTKDEAAMLRALLSERNEEVGMEGGAHPFSRLRVRIDAAPETEWLTIQTVMVWCMHEYVWDVWLGEVPVPLPKDEGSNPIPKRVVVPDMIRISLRSGSAGAVQTSLRYSCMIDLDPLPPEYDVEHFCAGFNELTEKLTELGAADPEMTVLIDSEANVPLKHVLTAIEACERLGAKVLFQAPPVDIGGGSDHWYE